MKKLIIFIAIAFASVSTANAQKIAIKNNLLADATASINLGVELGFAKHFSAELYGSWNPFIFSDRKQFRHILIQPEFRYWLCESFNGWFFGAHLFGAQYNVGNVNFPGYPEMKNFRWAGNMFGGGVTAGYQWIIGKRWNIEAALGGGYFYTNYEKWDCEKCGDFVKSGVAKGFVPTRATVAIVFFFN